MDLYEKTVHGNIDLPFLVTVSGSGRDNVQARIFFPDMALDSDVLRDIKYAAGIPFEIDGHLKLVDELAGTGYPATCSDITGAIYDRCQACLNRYGHANKERQVLFDKLKDDFPGLKELDQEPDEYILVNMVKRIR